MALFTSDTVQGLSQSLFAIAVLLDLLFAGFCIALGWTQSCNGNQFWQITVAAMLISLASAGIGYFLGFLFGLPRSTATAIDAGTHGYLDNSNLLEVSDWLTKIIVGISLVQIGKLPSALGQLGLTLAPMLGYSPGRCANAITNEKAIGDIGVAMCLAAAVVAFVLGYLFTRVRLLRVLRQDHTNPSGGT